MRRILLLLLLIPVLVLSKDKQANEPIMFHTDVACFDHQGLLEILKNKFGEDPVFVAKSDQLDTVTMVLINQQSGTTYTTVLTDRDSLVECSNTSAITVTIPPNSSVAYPVGTSIDILQTGAGQITVAAGAGVTVNATPGLKLRTQWSGATLFKRATDTWVLYGDLMAQI